MARLSGGMCWASRAAPEKSPKAAAPVSTGMTTARAPGRLPGLPRGSGPELRAPVAHVPARPVVRM